MADLEVKVIGDIGDLQAELEKLPGITKEEAAKIAKGMEKGMKDAEKAVKKASDGSSKAMQKVQKSAKKTGNSMKAMKKGASEMGRGLAELTLLFGDQDSKMGEFMATVATASLTMGAIVPLFGAMRTGIIGLGVSAGIATGGLSILAGGVALLVTNMMSANKEVEAQKKKVKKLALEHMKLVKSFEASVKKNKQFADSVINSKKAIDNFMADLEIELLTAMFERGQVSIERYVNELDTIAKNKAITTIHDQFDNLEKSLEKNTAHLKEQKEMAGELASGLVIYESIYTQLTDDASLYSQVIANTEEQTLNNLKLINLEDSIRNASLAEIANKYFQYKTIVEKTAAAEKELNQFKKNRKSLIEDTIKTSEKLNNLKSEDLKTELETKEAQEEQAKIDAIAAEKAAAKLAAAEALKGVTDQIATSQTITAQMAAEELTARIGETDALEDLIPLLNAKTAAEVQNLEHEKTSIANRIKILGLEEETGAIGAANQALINALKEESAAINLKIKRTEKEALQEIDDLTAKNAAKKLETMDLEKMRLQELYDLERQLRDASTAAEIQKHELIMRQIEAREKQDRDTMNKLMGNTKSFFAARIELMQNSGRAEQEAITKLFYMQQAAAAAQVGIQTAENVVSANKLLPPVGPILAASYVALGGAQIAAIMSQSPPTARHMGGMANDEANYRLLSGEAVLSRQAVRNIGGEQGLKRMERGKGAGSEIIILQPFKHFDRYLNQRNKRKARRASNGSY